MSDTDTELKIAIGKKATAGRFPVTVVRGADVVFAGEVNPHKADERDAIVAGVIAAGVALNGQEDKFRAALLQLALPRRKPKKEGKPGDNPFDRLSQQANAEQLAKELNGIARYNKSREEWMIVSADEGRLILDERGFVCRIAKRVARLQWANLANPSIDGRQAAQHAIDSEKAAGIAAMMKLAQTEPGISIVNSDLDRDILLLNTLDGVIDLRIGKLRERRPDDLLSKLAPIHHNQNATTTRWDSFLNRIMAGNQTMIGYLRRLAGLCLSGLATTQELYILHGGGANGKSVFIDTLIGMLGDYGGLAPDSLLTARSQGTEHPTEIADICGKRVVVGSETEEGAKLRVQLVKRLTGDATIKARFMRCDYFEFPRTHKLILVTNSRPKIGETTHAIWRRVRLIPFDVTIPPEEIDTELLVKLRAEWAGILNWAIKGFLDIQANGMQTPPEVMVATENYKAEQDPLAEYLSDRCIVDSAQKVSRNEIFADYAQWCKLAGDGTPDRAAFYDKLRRVDGVDETKLRMQGRITRVFTGIGLANVANQHRNSQEHLAEMA